MLFIELKVDKFFKRGVCNISIVLIFEVFELNRIVFKEFLNIVGLELLSNIYVVENNIGNFKYLILEEKKIR